MNKYEGMFLLDHGKVKNEVQKGIDEITGILTKHGAEVVTIGKWDERRLAYEINNQKRGTYVLCHFNAATAGLTEMTRDLNLNEIVSRHLLTRIETEFPDFMTAHDLDEAFGSREFRERRGGRPSRGFDGPRERRGDGDRDRDRRDDGNEDDDN